MLRWSLAISIDGLPAWSSPLEETTLARYWLIEPTSDDDLDKSQIEEIGVSKGGSWT